MDHILVTGGAGFVGSNLAIRFKEALPGVKITCLDNLRRRGSELIVPRLQQHDIRFVHGDVRIQDDLTAAGPADVIVDCSAEPSVLAGLHESPRYVIDTNLGGTVACLEHARASKACVMFLSTSRVYPVAAVNSLSYVEAETRFELTTEQQLPGASSAGISEEFPLHGTRSLYGASKLSSELLLHEYIDSYGIKAVINRCGVLTGPWQMGKVDQGVVVLWLARHFFGAPLSYIGFNGTGKQVRDMLHVDDLFQLVNKQLSGIDSCSGEVFNVGGGREISTSLRELTALSQKYAEREVRVHAALEDRPNDIRIYLTDCAKVRDRFDWHPQKGVEVICADIMEWLRTHERELRRVLIGP